MITIDNKFSSKFIYKQELFSIQTTVVKMSSKKQQSKDFFEELNSDSFLDKVSTSDLIIDQKYPIRSFRLIETVYGESLAVVLIINEEPRLYFLPEHVKNKSPNLIKKLKSQSEYTPREKKFLVYKGKQPIEGGKEMNSYVFVS